MQVAWWIRPPRLAFAGSEDNTFGTLGGTVTLDVADGELVIDKDEFSATVVTPDIMACNGIVHVIDGVIVPSIADIVTLDDILQYHVYAAEAAVSAATALTLEDAAITMLNGDEAIVDGGTSVSVTDTGGTTSTVTITDIYAANGIIHVINGVLLPESITE